MALLPNSSLQSWIFFYETNWNNVSFPPCQSVNWTIPNADEPTYNLKLPIKTIASCAQVCNDSVSLFGSQDNLATCGLWSTLVYAYNSDPGFAPDPNLFIGEAPEDLLDSFANVGLDAHDPEYFESAVSYVDVMSACFVFLYQNVKTVKSANDGLVSGACTKNGLFPYSPGLYIGVQDALYYSTTALDTCLVDICSPVALNPEFAGVGAQCYFASTVQITALILFHGTDGSTILNETSALVVLVTSGFIPVTFGFASITRFGRPNLHLITLSVITSALATAALLAFYHYDNQFGDFDDYYSSLQDDYMSLGPCAIGGTLGQTLFPLCGSSFLDNNFISSTIITKWWVWATWAICMAWMVLCLLYNIVRDKRPPEKVHSKFDSLTRHPSMKLLKKIAGKLKGRMLIFIVTPTLCFGVCFGVQFYLIILFNRHHLVSQVWSFGQIIAVTVWLPSICEYCHDVLHSQNFKDWLGGVKGHLKPKYTPLVRAMRDIVQQKVNMANDVQIGRSNHTASSGSDPEAIPLSSAVDSHGTGQEDQQSEIVIGNSVEPA